ncbi:MAG TPA: hypothetical protein PKJ41_19075 [Bryobacteraceae bacterium]|nr:hypothetical protein [Bryobacteraceae bacterium]
MFRRTGGRQAGFPRDIFVQVGPVDPFAASDETPVGSLDHGPVFQAREPGQRRGDGAAIGEIHNECVPAQDYRLHQRLLNLTSWRLH